MRPKASVEAEAQPPALPMFANTSRGPESSSLMVTYRLPQPVTLSRFSPRNPPPRLPRADIAETTPSVSPAPFSDSPLRLTLPMFKTCASRDPSRSVSYTHLRAHETDSYLVC